jgi:hypothetical protein
VATEARNWRPKFGCSLNGRRALNEYRPEIKDEEANRSDASDLQWRVDQYVLGCDSADCESGFDREAFETEMLGDEGLALRVASAVEDWGIIGEAARGLAAELDRSECDRFSQAIEAGRTPVTSPSREFALVKGGFASLGFKLSVLAASVLLVVASAAFWFSRGSVSNGVSSGFASSTTTAELVDSWLALSPESESADGIERFDGVLKEVLEEDWLSVQEVEDEPVELEDDWMRFGAELFAEEADRSDA